MSEIHGYRPTEPPEQFPMGAQEDKIKNAILFLKSMTNWANRDQGWVNEGDVNCMVDHINSILDSKITIDPRDRTQLQAFAKELSNSPHNEIGNAQVNIDTLNNLMSLLNRLNQG
jgi:hypothetical protein